MPFNDESATIVGRLRKKLEREGRTIGPHDTRIAAIALPHDMTRVTNHTDEFSRVVGMKI